MSRRKNPAFLLLPFFAAGGAALYLLRRKKAPATSSKPTSGDPLGVDPVGGQSHGGCYVVITTAAGPLTIRAEATMDSPAVGTVPKGMTVLVDRTQSGGPVQGVNGYNHSWHHLADGRGFISSAFTSPLDCS